MPTNWDDAVQIANVIGQVVQAVLPLIREHYEQTGQFPSADQIKAQLLGDEQAVLAKGQAWAASHPQP